MNKVKTCAVILGLIGTAFPCRALTGKPTLWLVGDSTVNNGTPGLQGWGTPIAQCFDPAKITVANRARGGRSSRTFFTEGLWGGVEQQLNPGDFVLMQFGHNDAGAVDRELAPGRPSRASLKGNGEETQEVRGVTGQLESVHSYGWYLRQFIAQAKAKGATPIVLSMVPRNDWKEGKVLRASGGYGKWAEDAAKQGGALFVDLNEIVANHYDGMGQEKVKEFFPMEHTHTNSVGARFNAACVVEGLEALPNCALKNFLLPHSARAEVPVVATASLAPRSVENQATSKKEAVGRSFGSHSASSQVPQELALDQSGKDLVLTNGIVTATITRNASISSLKYKGYEMASAIYYSMDGGANYRTPGGGQYFVHTKTPDRIDIGFKKERKSEPQAFDCEIHYVLQRGLSGIYTYAILSHPSDYPKSTLGEWRMVWKLSNDLLEKIYVDDLRHWEMPSSEDYKSAEPTGIKEIVKLTRGVRADQYDCKYDFNASYYALGCWGHASDRHKIGGWIVLGGVDFLNDGPTKQDLTAASGINHIHLGMNHYNGSTTTVEAGESWQKIYGPFLLYCNTDEKGGDALWADAKHQVETEKAQWPYSWVAGTASYPPAKERGSLSGHLVIKDTLKPALTAARAWVGLAQPDPGGNWQFESKNYQYWVKADAAGNFSIPNIRAGTYTLYAFTDGAVGEYARQGIAVKTGANHLPGDLEWEVPHKGHSIAWEIGIPNRSADEFRHGRDYFHGFVWTHFNEEFKNPLDFTVGKSNWATDWNYAQSWYQVGQERLPHKWRIHFNLAKVPTQGEAYMTFAIAGAHGGAKINVYVNREDAPFAAVTPSIQGGNALLRESIHAKYCVEYLAIPIRLLKQGANTITLEQSRTDPQTHVMYDYLNLELP